MEKFSVKKSVGAVASVVGMSVTSAYAAVPAYVTDALTAATTKFDEYLGAAAPVWLTAVAGIAGLFMVGRLIVRAFKGR